MLGPLPPVEMMPPPHTSHWLVKEEWNSLTWAIAALEGLGARESGQLEGTLPLLPLPRQQPAVARASAESGRPAWALGSAAPAWAGPLIKALLA